MTRQYVDISHFRAPYTNWPTLNGFGADPTMTFIDASTPTSILPAPVDASTPTSILPAPVDASTPTPIDGVSKGLIFTEPTGIRVLSPAAAILLANLLPNSSVIQVDTDTVKLDVRLASDPFRPSGIDWMNQKLGEGKSIVVGADGGLEALISTLSSSGNPVTVPPPGVIGLIATTDEAKFAGPGSAFTAVLVRPTPQQKAVAVAKAGIGPYGIAALAVLGIGGAVLLFGKKKRR